MMEDRERIRREEQTEEGAILYLMSHTSEESLASTFERMSLALQKR